MRIFVASTGFPVLLSLGAPLICSARRCPSFFCFRLIFHYLFVVWWLQYLLLDLTLPAIGKGLAVPSVPCC